MPAPAWENLFDFLSVDDFATLATLTLQNGTTRQVAGIYDDPYLNAQLGEYETDTSAPRFLCREVDTAGVLRGDELTIGADKFDILSAPHSDGTGMVTLMLAPQGRL
jgi:hypothetical protein